SAGEPHGTPLGLMCWQLGITTSGIVSFFLPSSIYFKQKQQRARSTGRRLGMATNVRGRPPTPPPCRRSGIKDLEHGRGVNLWIESACWKTLSDKQLVFSKNRYTSNVAICVDIVQGKTSLNSLRLSFIFGGESQIGKALDNLHGFQA